MKCYQQEKLAVVDLIEARLQEMRWWRVRQMIRFGGEM